MNVKVKNLKTDMRTPWYTVLRDAHPGRDGDEDGIVVRVQYPDGGEATRFFTDPEHEIPVENVQ